MRNRLARFISEIVAKIESARANSPTPAEIRAAREAAGITQTAAGVLLHTTCRTWQKWEAGDRKMHPAFWELFRIKSAGMRSPKDQPSQELLDSRFKNLFSPEELDDLRDRVSGKK